MSLVSSLWIGRTSLIFLYSRAFWLKNNNISLLFQKNMGLRYFQCFAFFLPFISFLSIKLSYILYHSHQASNAIVTSSITIIRLTTRFLLHTKMLVCFSTRLKNILRNTTIQSNWDLNNLPVFVLGQNNYFIQLATSKIAKYKKLVVACSLCVFPFTWWCEDAAQTMIEQIGFCHATPNQRSPMYASATQQLLFMPCRYQTTVFIASAHHYNSYS